MHDHLFEYLDVHGLIYKNQSGFRKQYSTEMALAYIVDSLLFNLDRNCVNGMVLVDYKKAFDMVDHVILLRMLEAYKLQSWTKVLGQSCTFGHPPDANTTSPAQPRPPSPIQC